MSDSISAKLRHLRKSKALTQQQVADRVGIKRSTISNYEIGCRTPHLKDLQKISDFFGVGLDYFGVTPIDEVFDALARAKEVFENPDIDKEAKEELYRAFMVMYLNIKGENK